MLVVLPLAATLTAFYVWTLNSLNFTLKDLRERKQHVKEAMYKKLWWCILISILVIFAFFFFNSSSACSIFLISSSSSSLLLEGAGADAPTSCKVLEATGVAGVVLVVEVEARVVEDTITILGT